MQSGDLGGRANRDQQGMTLFPLLQALKEGSSRSGSGALRRNAGPQNPPRLSSNGRCTKQQEKECESPATRVRFCAIHSVDS